MQDHHQQVDPLSVARPAHTPLRSKEVTVTIVLWQKKVRLPEPPKQVPFPRRVAATPQPLNR
jgi:hypothetical protein